MQRRRRTGLAGGAATVLVVLLALPFSAVAGGWTVGTPPTSAATIPLLSPVVTPAPLPTLWPLPTLGPLPTLAPLPSVGSVPSVGPLPSVGPSPSDVPQSSNTPSVSEPSETGTSSPPLTTGPTPDDSARLAPSTAATAAVRTSPPEQEGENDNADASPRLGSSADPGTGGGGMLSGRSGASSGGTGSGTGPDRGSAAEEPDNDEGPLPASSLIAPGLVATVALAGALALAHLFGIGLGALGGIFSAIAAGLDRRAGRNVRGFVAAVPGIRRWGSPGPEGEDPIVAAMNPPLLARDPGSE